MSAEQQPVPAAPNPERKTLADRAKKMGEAKSGG
jgi:hypothetical protein